MLNVDYDSFDFESRKRLSKTDLKKIDNIFRKVDKDEGLLEANHKKDGKIYPMLGMPLYLLETDEQCDELQDLLREIGDDIQYYYQGDYYWLLK